MKWNRESLSDKGIFYDEEIRGISIPYALDPPHVEVLRASMLDFSCSIVSVDDTDDTLVVSPLYEAASSWRQPQTDPIVRQVYQAQEEATHLRRGGFPETRWAQLFHKWFFEPLENATSKASGNVRRSSRNNYYYDGFKTAGETESWTFFDERRNKYDTSTLLSYERERCPKPDYACFLPIYHLDAEPKIPQAHGAEGRNWHQSANHCMVEQFSWTLLKKLRPYGLEPTPFKIFHADPTESSLKCYPWLVVEHKKESDESSEYRVREAVYCQATNAAACAIQLNIQAAKYALKSAECAQVPPLPVITTIGPKIKAWIMCQAQEFRAPTDHPRFWREMTGKHCKEGFMMRAIWEGDITNIEDAAKFQIILENTHTWAMRVFRPLISSYINIWKCVHLENNVEALYAQNQLTKTVNRNGTAMSMIQGFLKDLDPADLAQSEGKNIPPLLLGMLFHMISNTERKSLVEELSGIIDAKISRLTVRAETVSSQQHTTHQQSQGFHENLSNIFSRLSTVDNDDPGDSDFVDSQPSQSKSPGVHFRHQPRHQSPGRPNTGSSDTVFLSRLSKIPGNQAMGGAMHQPETSRLSPLYTRTSPIPSVENPFSPQTHAGGSPVNTGRAAYTKPSSVSELQDTSIPKVELRHSSFNSNTWMSSSISSSSPLCHDTGRSPISQVRTNKAADCHRLSHVNRCGTCGICQSDQGKAAAPRVSLGTPVFSFTEPRSPSRSVFSPSLSPKNYQTTSHPLNPSLFDTGSNTFSYLSEDSSSAWTDDSSATAAYIDRQDEDDSQSSGNRIIY